MIMSTRRSAASMSLLAAFAVLTACSSSGNATKPPSTTPVASAAATPPATSATVTPSGSGTPADPATKTAVSSVYETFFNPATKPATSQADLQNGSAFTSSLASLATTAKAQKTSVKVSAVTVAGPVATVTFTLYGSGTPVLPNTHGLAVLVNGKWQVAAQTFCALVGLQGSPPAACTDTANTALPQ